MGELEPWIDENFVRSVWYNMGEQVNVKMIRDKFSGWAYLLWSWQSVLIVHTVTPGIASSTLQALLLLQRH